MKDEMETQTVERLLEHLHAITDFSDPGGNVEKALVIYGGTNHASIHHEFVARLETLPYPALLLFHGGIPTPLFSDTLELRIRVLARIMQQTGWDGTWKMLDNHYPGRPIRCTKLSGHIVETYLYSNGTPQSIIFETEEYLHHDGDIHIVRAALFEIFAWLATSTFDAQAEPFLAGLIGYAAHSKDASVKAIAADITDQVEKTKKPFQQQ